MRLIKLLSLSLLIGCSSNQQENDNNTCECREKTFLVKSVSNSSIKDTTLVSWTYDFIENCENVNTDTIKEIISLNPYRETFTFNDCESI